MMNMNYSALFAFFVSFPLIFIGGLALYYSLASRHKRISEHESIYVCDHCQNVYAFARTRPMDRCPRCGHLNDAVRS